MDEASFFFIFICPVSLFGRREDGQKNVLKVFGLKIG
jgi:hypothetical protein